MKTCITCKIQKSLSDYYSSSRYKSGYLNKCKPCVLKLNIMCDQKFRSKRREKHREWNALNKEKIKEYRRKSNLKFNYNLTQEQFDQMALSQNGRCAICREAKKLVVDHCHKTGIVRGLLCSLCNSGLGYFKDSLYNLTTAYRYLFNKEPLSMVNRESK